MKNIILIDLGLTYIESIYKSKKVNIEFLITEADDVKLAKIKETYDIKNIISRAQFHEASIQEDTEINFDVIENLMKMHFNKEQLGLIQTYLYTLLPDPDWDGQITLKRGEKEVDLAFKDPLDVYAVILSLEK